MNPFRCRQVCLADASDKQSNLLILRSLKPLRLIKLLKAFKIISALKEELAIMLGLTTVKMIALFVYLVSRFSIRSPHSSSALGCILF